MHPVRSAGFFGALELLDGRNHCSLARSIPWATADTNYECDCTRCWDTVAATESLDWITVSLMECPLRFNDTTIRKRIANWINEECGASLNCGLKEQLDKDHVVIGHFECEEEKNELRLVALLNDSRGLTQVHIRKSDCEMDRQRTPCPSTWTGAAVKGASSFVFTPFRNSRRDSSPAPERNSSVKNGHQQYSTASSRCSSRLHPADTIVNLFFSSLRELGSYSKGGMAP
ncbi:hypothetical protein ANCCAN_13061 [Ancylostoma caninum]|uniref:Uncharacterized protein n=1 Tax=Ancylostoma caninum TaxID=29170 RepID=A0A368G9D8_ANCCA|nr:hypothetical protein ANCCAN_13061 [Ancylostoma caninum]